MATNSNALRLVLWAAAWAPPFHPCGCSNIAAILEFVRKLLAAMPRAGAPSAEYFEAREQFHRLFDSSDGAAEVALILMDNIGLIEHGSGLRGSWRSERGDAAAAIFEAVSSQDLIEAAEVYYQQMETIDNPDGSFTDWLVAPLPAPWWPSEIRS